MDLRRLNRWAAPGKGFAQPGRLLLGARGEAVAVAALRARGYRVLARNVRSRAGELDVVCADGDAIVFCEVKARRPSAFGLPEEALTAAKRARLARLAAGYLARVGRREAEWRVELVAVQMSPGGEAVRADILPVTYEGA